MAEYIEREALLHDIEQSVVYTARGKITSAEMRGARKIIERIKCAPAVEPIYIHEPTKSEFKRMVVHGQWLRSDDDWDSLTLIRCSICGEEWCFEMIDDVTLLNYKYCPNCGAKMDGVEEREK